MSPADAIALPFIERDFETPRYDRKLALDRARTREYKQNGGDKVTIYELHVKFSEAVQRSDIPERLNRITQDMANIAAGLQGVSEEFLRMIAPVCDIVKDAVQLVCEIVSEEIAPKTIPPRDPVRSIGGQPQIKGLAPMILYRARSGARHT